MKGIEGHYKANVRVSPNQTGYGTDKTGYGPLAGIKQKSIQPAVQLNLQEISEFWELCLQ